MGTGGQVNTGGVVNAGGITSRGGTGLAGQTGTGGRTGTGGVVGSGGVSGAGGSSSPDAGMSSCHTPGQLQVVNSGATAYVIDGVNNPDLTFCRGSSYVFVISATGHPFYIKTVQGTGTGNAYSNGVTGNGTTNGNVTFSVPQAAPDTLFYDCSLHSAMTGTIHIVN